MNKVYGLLLLASCSMLGCKKKDENYTVPTTYNFENVDLIGQLQRTAMLTELSVYMNSNTMALDAARMKNMLANEGLPFADASLNDSGRQLKNKMVDTQPVRVEEWMDSLAAVSASRAQTASNGQAGIATDSSNGSQYLVNAQGVEFAELIEKVIVGACFYYQATAVYLGTGKMSADNTNVVAGTGTNMEHHWDEAFGYLGVALDFPTNTNNLKYLGYYSNLVNPVLGTNARIMNAFLKGRAAISNDDYQTRDEQIVVIRQVWEEIICASAIHYLNEAKTHLTLNNAAKLHALSAGYGLIEAIEFGGNPSFTTPEVEEVLRLLAGSENPVEANFYDVTAIQINAAIDAIVAKKSDLSSVKDSL